MTGWCILARTARLWALGALGPKPPMRSEMPPRRSLKQVAGAVRMDPSGLPRQGE